jgi:Fasciclin domain
MKSSILAPVGAALAMAIATSAGAQTVMEHKLPATAKPTVGIVGPDKPAAQGIIGPEKPQLQPPVSHDAMKAGPGGGPWRGHGSGGGEGLGAMLAKEGRFNTFLAIVKAAGMDDWERGPKIGWDGDGRAGFCDGSVRPTGWDGDGKAGFCDGSVHPVTVLAPDDAAFAAMDKGRLATLTSDRAVARAFVMAHVVGRPLKVTDMFNAGDLNSEKQVMAASGDPLKLLCNGRHDGMHHPRINGMAKVGDVQDVAFSGGVIQEIDGLLVK